MQKGVARFPLIEKELAGTCSQFRAISEALTHMLSGYRPRERTQISLSLIYPSLVYPALMLWRGLEAQAPKTGSLEFKALALPLQRIEILAFCFFSQMCVLHACICMVRGGTGMCVCLCACICMHTHAHEHPCDGARLMLGIMLSHPSVLFIEARSLNQIQYLPIFLVLPASSSGDSQPPASRLKGQIL